MAMPNNQPDYLLLARYEGHSKVCLIFADGFSGTWSFQQLGLLYMDGMRPETIRASACGASMEMTSMDGHQIDIDSACLRGMVDPVFAAELEREIIALRGPLANLLTTDKLRVVAAKHKPPQSWYDEDDDLC